MLVCIQCALEAFVAGTSYTPTDEEQDEHMRRAHPNGVPPGARAELERKATEKLQAEGQDLKDWLRGTMKDK